MFGKILKITMRRRWAQGAGWNGHRLALSLSNVWTPIKNDKKFNWLDSLIYLISYFSKLVGLRVSCPYALIEIKTISVHR